MLKKNACAVAVTALSAVAAGQCLVNIQFACCTQEAHACSKTINGQEYKWVCNDSISGLWGTTSANVGTPAKLGQVGSQLSGSTVVGGCTVIRYTCGSIPGECYQGSTQTVQCNSNTYRGPCNGG